MNRLRSNLVLIASALFFSGALLWRIARPHETALAAGQPGETLQVGENVPEYWRDLGMPEAPRGVVLVTFLTTECPWARNTVPRWNRIASAIQEVPGGAVVAVSLSHPDSTRTFPAETGLRLPLRVVGDRPMYRKWKIVAVPYTLVIEPSGRVAGIWRGAMTDDDMGSAVALVRRWRPEARE
jgi:peroxiredoxin